MTKGTIIEVNVSELGLVTAGGKVVWGKYAQVGLLLSFLTPLLGLFNRLWFVTDHQQP